MCEGGVGKPKSAYTPLTHTHIHQLNLARLLVHLQRQYNPTGLPVCSQALSGIHPQSYWSACTFTGMHLQSHWAPCAFTRIHPNTNPQSRCPPQAFSPIPGSMFLNYISYKRQHGPACVLARCGVQSSGIFVALWPTCVVLSRYDLILLAFITGNSSLEPLLEGQCAQIHIDLSFICTKMTPI